MGIASPGSVRTLDDDLRHRIAPVALRRYEIADAMNTAMDVNKALATCARRTAGTAAYRAGYGNTELVVGFAAGVIGGA